MSLALQRSEFFNRDFDLQYRWYLANAGEEVAERYRHAVWTTLRSLADQPQLGRRRAFPRLRLQELRSFRVEPPFDAHMIFYRHTATELSAERLMHGARDLPRRLREPPGSQTR
jgi:plasmid stabilization system protein ParE